MSSTPWRSLAAARLGAIRWLALLPIACTTPPTGEPGRVALAFADASPTFTLPERSRAELPSLHPIGGPWRELEVRGAHRRVEAPLPVRLRTLFFHRPPDDMALYWAAEDGDREGPALRHGKAPRRHQWTFTENSVQLWISKDDPLPEPGALLLRYGPAVARERSLQLAESGLEVNDFAMRTVQLGATSRRGLLLPAPATAAWEVTVPRAGILAFAPNLIAPESAPNGPGSDGARLRVVVQPPSGDQITVYDEALLPVSDKAAEVTPRRIDLGRWGGQALSLRFEVDALENNLLDYVFIADPVLYTPEESPQRVVVVLIDTLRQDALGIYGATRDTSPVIDRWAKEGRVYTAARSVAPWTLPSSRALLSGRAPETWGDGPDLPTRLGAAGWYTGMFAGNIYLSSTFDMEGGWSEHRTVNWPSADDQVDEALAALARWPDRPALLLVHFMDAHLPYREPEAWRGRFAGEPPARFSRREFHRLDVLRAPLSADEQAWVRGRYDNNVAYIDHTVGRLLRALPKDATVILTADHGEEFWDHGEFEHGHSLNEELLRVPMIARGPQFSPGSSAEPVSLLDVTPTILEAAGLPSGGMDGASLQSLASAPPAAPRPLTFGRPLYGDRRWGLAVGDEKYTLHADDERLADLAADPLERAAEVPAEPGKWRGALGQALGRPVGLAIRVAPMSVVLRQPLEIRVRAPGGVAWIELSEDPAKRTIGSTAVEGDTAVFVWSGENREAGEGWVMPRLPLGAEDIELVVKSGSGPPTTLRVPAADLVGEAARSLPMVRAMVNDEPSGPRVRFGLSPTPAPSGLAQIEGVNEEVRGELEALGYADPAHAGQGP